MNTRTRTFGFTWLLAAVLAWPMAANAQVPVGEDGKPIGQVEPNPGASIEELTVLSAAELEVLIGPIALYPDDLLAIILPASTYPLQIVQAARFLEDLEKDSSLKPDEDWDDSVVALTNYPEIVEMMSEDLDWTWRLGEAVVGQQTDVITAIEAFRDRAYAAGNLKSDDFQNVTEEDGAIQITPVEEDVIYVPYYEPESVVVYQPRPVYYYYPRSYPVYYYPYPSGYAFNHGYFWGVTTAFSIGWYSHNLHVWHHSYYGHPYYGRNYYNDWWYRRPDIHVYNNYYGYNHRNYSHDRYRRGDYWHPQTRNTVRSSDQRVTRTRYYPSSGTQSAATTGSLARSASGSRSERSKNAHRTGPQDRVSEPRQDIQFRERERTATTSQSSRTVRSPTVRPSTEAQRSSSRPSQTRRSSERPTTIARLSEPTQSSSRPSQQRQSYVQPSQSRQSSSRPSQQRQSYVQPSQSRQSYVQPSQSRQSSSRPSQPRQSSSRPSQPRQSSSRPSQPRQSSSRPSQPRQSSSPPSRSKSSHSSSGKQSSSSRGSRSERGDK